MQSDDHHLLEGLSLSDKAILHICSHGAWWRGQPSARQVMKVLSVGERFKNYLKLRGRSMRQLPK
jgi:hypothetical protein